MSFELHHATSLAEASALALRYGENATFIAGGTDLVIQINRKVRAPSHLIDITRVTALEGVTITQGLVTIGALTTHKAIERHSAFEGALSALAEGARVIGGHQVRNIATIGGNIANASPAADLLPPLLALDAMIVLASAAEERVVALKDLLVGPGRTSRRRDEVIREIRVPRSGDHRASAFLKAGRRKAMEISLVNVAASLSLDADGNCRSVRVALGAVAPTAIRVNDVETLVEGRAPTDMLFAEAGRAAAAAARPIDDVRASARYRVRLVETMVVRALTRCVERAVSRR